MVTADPLLIFTVVVVIRAATVRPPTSPWDPPPQDMEKTERRRKIFPPKQMPQCCPGPGLGIIPVADPEIL